MATDSRMLRNFGGSNVVTRQGLQEPNTKPARPSRPTCGNCRFAHVQKRESGLKCRRYPPSVPGIMRGSVPVFPTVATAD